MMESTRSRPSVVRCAIYTRKSSEEGLEQDFNSLDAQREACAAYILSQASEGWTALPDRYDDGGISGGTLDRPALRQLLADVAAGRIDTVVVYKVDRLSRSLFDFAKLVEAFEKAGTSFVSVTQSFNTTTSMGRLTLNMLLSFAQFEREVTAERIRDKIAASKARGMWMGGVPPIGYAPDGRSLKVVEDHAALVRYVFARYLDLGNVRRLADELAREGHVAPLRTLATGRQVGGGRLSRGQLYKMLGTPTYIAEVHHRGAVHAASHPPVIARDVWDRTRAMLASNRQGCRQQVRAASPSLLAGRITDPHGNALIASHACKGKVRYRYYIRDARGETPALRVPARAAEQLVATRLAALLDSPLPLIDKAGLDVPPEDYPAFARQAPGLAARVRATDRVLIPSLIAAVVVEPHCMRVTVDAVMLANELGVGLARGAPARIELVTDARLRRSGRAMRLVDTSGTTASADPNTALIRLLGEAHRLWRILRTEPIDITRLAAREGMQPSYLTRVLRLAFLSPALTTAILEGRQPRRATVRVLTLEMALPGAWEMQALVLE